MLNGVSSTYSILSPNNRLASVTGGVTRSNTFDLAGNPLSDGINSYVHDGRGRLTSATGGGVATSYLINYQGLRVKKSNSLETKNFVYDDAGHVIGEYDGNGNAIQELIWLGDTPVAVTGAMPCLTGTNCTETGTAYVWTDHLNTPRELTRVNGSGQHVSIWKWDSLPFGETVPNGNPSNLSVMTFNHRFPGQYYDKETGLHQNWNRDYDPRIGRYVQSDPIGLEGGTNTYGYSGSSPIVYADSSGLDPLVIIGTVVGGVCGAIQAANSGGGWTTDNALNIAAGTLSGAAVGAVAGFVPTQAGPLAALVTGALAGSGGNLISQYSSSVIDKQPFTPDLQQAGVQGLLGGSAALLGFSVGFNAALSTLANGGSGALTYAAGVNGTTAGAAQIIGNNLIPTGSGGFRRR